jgi:hypothetical protein
MMEKKDMTIETYPVCPQCNRAFAPGQWWQGANYCRGLFLLNEIYVKSGLSAWELSQESGMAYRDVTKGLQKLRDWDIVVTETEEREQGGIRYRYFPVGDDKKNDRFRFEEAAQVAAS